MENFREIPLAAEILSLLKEAPADDYGQIWQTREKSRDVYKIINIDDVASQDSVMFETKGSFNFNRDYPVYIRVNHRDLIFKLDGDSIKISNNKLICGYPKMAKALEERKNIRFPVPELKDFFVTLAPISNTNIHFNVKLLNFSKHGIGIVINDRNKFYIQNNESFKIISLNDMVFPGSNEVSLRHSRNVGDGIQAGFNLKTEFSDSLLQVLTKFILEA
ncbi:MAG: hypothetical protein ACLGHN_13015 [Bacteriovoracia bacterium]